MIDAAHALGLSHNPFVTDAAFAGDPASDAAWVVARVVEAGGNRGLFEPAAISALSAATDGDRGRLRRLAGLALIEAAFARGSRVTAEHVEAAVAAVPFASPKPVAPPTPANPRRVRRWLPAAAAAAAIAAFVGAISLVRGPNPASTPPAVAPQAAQPRIPASIPAATAPGLAAAPPDAALPTPEPPSASRAAIAGTDEPSRVVLHHAPGDAAAARAVADRLAASGWNVSSLRPVGVAVTTPSARYFHATDAAAARRLAVDVGTALGRDIRVGDLRRYRPLPRRHTLEVWLPTRPATPAG